MVGLMAISSKRAYAIPKSAAPRAPASWQSIADPFLHRRCSNTVLSQPLWSLWALVCTRLVWKLEPLWREWGLILNMNSPLLLSCWCFSFALWNGISPQRSSSAVQPPLQHLLSSWDFSDLAGALSNWDCFSFFPSKIFMAKQNLQSWSGK